MMSRRQTTSSMARRKALGAAFLLSQVGFHSSRLWRNRLTPLGMDPREVLLLRYIASLEGQSQRAVASSMRIPVTRMASVVDGLERRGLVERRPRPDDRRVFLTSKGSNMLNRIMQMSVRHEAQLFADLNSAERRRLIGLLSRVAAGQRLPRRLAGGRPRQGRRAKSRSSRVLRP
jgi:DNA-binding MarR family transcriptional regulator